MHAFLKLFNILRVFCFHVYIYAFWCLQRSEEGTEFPGSGVVVSRHVGGGCWVLGTKSQAFVEQQGLFTSVPALQPVFPLWRKFQILVYFPLSFFFLAVLEKTSRTILVNLVREDSLPLLPFRWGILRVSLLTVSIPHLKGSSAIVHVCVCLCMFTHVVYVYVCMCTGVYYI